MVKSRSLLSLQETELMLTSDSEEESDEEHLWGAYDAADLHRHPQLDADIQAVRSLCPGSTVSVSREYGSIDGVDVDLNININFLDKEVTEAWRVHPSEPVVIRLHFCSSQYLTGPAPSVEVFQPSNRDHFNLGKQLKNILTDFISRQWNRVSNESIGTQAKNGQSWFNQREIIKNVHASLNVWIPQSRSSVLQEASGREKVILPAMKLNCFTDHSTSYIIKNSTGELFTYTPSGKVMVSAVKSPAHLGAKQLVELLFSSQVIGHRKSTPTMEHGFLVQIVRYAEQRIPTLSEYCVVCDEKHVFQNGPVLKPAVCSRELCVFSYYTLGVMSGVTEEVATGAEVADLLVAMCRAALQSTRKSIIFEPYPCVVDPYNPKTLAFSPKRKNYDRLQKALDSILLIRRMAQGPDSEIKMHMDKVDPLAHPLLQWILRSNRSNIVKLPPNRQLKFMHTPHQFLLICSPPFKEACFQTARNRHGSTFAFHGSHIENWHSILRNGLVNASYTKLQLHGAAYGKGIYLSPVSSISFGYSEMGKGRHRMPTKEELRRNCKPTNKQKQQQQQQQQQQQLLRQRQPCPPRFLYNRNLNCIALCEVITSKDLQKHGNIWVCPTADHVCTRFLFVYENGQVGDAHVNTQEAKIHKEILQAIASMSR